LHTASHSSFFLLQAFSPLMKPSHCGDKSAALGTPGMVGAGSLQLMPHRCWWLWLGSKQVQRAESWKETSPYLYRVVTIVYEHLIRHTRAPLTLPSALALGSHLCAGGISGIHVPPHPAHPLPIGLGIGIPFSQCCRESWQALTDSHPWHFPLASLSKQQP
jgi:hypothetical protein